MRVRCANKASAECIMRGRGITTTSLTPQGVVEPSRFSRSGESSAKTTTETAQEMSNAERKEDFSNESREVTRRVRVYGFCCKRRKLLEETKWEF